MKSMEHRHTIDRCMFLTLVGFRKKPLALSKSQANIESLKIRIPHLLLSDSSPSKLHKINHRFIEVLYT
ncbi:hypothetical protein LXL04_029675 [Taraxacum kok-saghyz]